MKYSLGLELGSTRIKAVLIDEPARVIANGEYAWENQFKNGYWTYDLLDAEKGVKTCIKNLVKNYQKVTKKAFPTIASMGVSAMMHGYLAFDKNDHLLVPFRTWRNTTTSKASEALTKLFNFNIPQRWSIAHLYQAILNHEKHINQIAYITTLAGYIHYRLTGEHSVGIGDASGIFPIDSKINDYNQTMVKKFNHLIKGKVKWQLLDVLPKVKVAGEKAGYISKAGLKYLGLTNQKNILMCPAEGDAGTGMVATNSVRLGTGNVSAGTSDFAMIVTNKKLGVHPEIDMVTTPSGLPVAMVHCNNCTSDINAWVNLFSEVLKLNNKNVPTSELFTKLFNLSLKGEKDAGELTSFNYFSGEGVTNLNAGKPLLIREVNARFTLANFMKMNIMSSLATLKLGLDILTKNEHVTIKQIYGHGGLFKTPKVGQLMLSAAINAPVSVFTTSGEGGPYGMAILASYLINHRPHESLENYLADHIFKGSKVTTLKATAADVKGFNQYIKRYQKYLAVEKEAIK
ncbi:MAG: ATPase [Bacilli bacterium]|nr:ATPase [Bacilli bacterium]